MKWKVRLTAPCKHARLRAEFEYIGAGELWTLCDVVMKLLLKRKDRGQKLLNKEISISSETQSYCVSLVILYGRLALIKILAVETH